MYLCVWRAFIQTDRGGQCQEFGRRRFSRTAASEVARQRDRPKPDPNQPTHDQAHRLDHPTYFAIAPFAQGHRVPAIDAIATGLLELIETRRSVFKVDPLDEPQSLLRIEFTEHAHCILALDFVAGMHEARRKVAPSRQEQQATRVVIEPTDRNPAA